MHPFLQQQLDLTRRQFFGSSGIRLGALAMASLAGKTAANDPAATAAVPTLMHPPLPGLPHFPPQREVGDLSAHERRPGADGHVGL